MSHYLLLKRLRVQNANALSSAFTFGFPAVTAFMGLAHRLQRELNPDNDTDEFQCLGVGMASHSFTMQDHQEGYNRSLKLTANPLDKDGNRPSFVEEGRCNLTVSVLLEVENLPTGREYNELPERLKQLLLSRFKLAGGDILDLQSIEILMDDEKVLRRLMPSYVLIERRDLMQAAMQDGQDALEALHAALQLNHTCTDLGHDQGQWQTSRQHKGWMVPIANGFHALSPVALADNQRDSGSLHRFAEAVVTLGEFKMPIRCESVNEIIWRYQQDGDLYLCTQQAVETRI